jgi:hypothetical protein
MLSESDGSNIHQFAIVHSKALECLEPVMNYIALALEEAVCAD